jgi:DNA-binding NarL/FixJ family response regulator
VLCRHPVRVLGALSGVVLVTYVAYRLISESGLSIRKSFREGDFAVCGEAENGKEAIQKAQILSPALIVTDLSMPLMNGLEETRILKKLMPAVPVIVFTSHSDPLVEKEAAAAGAFAVVSKSQAATVLIATARSLLNQKAA